MKRKISTAFLAIVCALGMAPIAYAQHSDHSQKMDPAMMKMHENMMQQGMKNGQMFSERATDLFNMGNSMITTGKTSKNAEMMMNGAEMMMMGLHMRKHAMKGMHKMHEHMMQGMMHHMMDNDAKQMDSMKAHMQECKKNMETQMADMKKDMMTVAERGNDLLAMGNELMLKGKTAKDSKMMMVGAHMLNKGMKLMMSGHGEHQGAQKKMMKKSPMMEEECDMHTSHHMEKEIRIEKKIIK